MFKRLTTYSLGLLLLLGGFQNCRSSSGGTPQIEAQSSGGSGNGYDGKLFVHISIDRICPDGSPVESSIEFINGSPTLVRENCADLPLALRRVVAVTTDPADPTYIVYSGVIYVDALARIKESAVDAQGNTFVAGEILPPGTTQWWDAKWKHTFIAKMDSADRLVWAYKVGGENPFEVTNVVTRSDGSVAVAGFFGNAAQILALSTEGRLLWSRGYSAPNASLYSTNLAVDHDGHLYLSTGDSLVKLKPNGDILWERETQAGFGVLATGPDNSVYAARLGHLKRMDRDGNLLWTTLADYNLAFNKLLVLADGSFIAIGKTSAFGDSVVAKFSSGGGANWISQLKHADGHVGSNPHDVAVGPQGLMVSSTRLTNGMQELRGVLYGVNHAGQFLWAVDHPSQLDGEVRFKNGKVRVRANASLMRDSEVRQSYFLEMLESSAAPTCRHCTNITATAEAYPQVVQPGRTVTAASRVQVSDKILSLLSLRLKLEVRE